MKTILIFKERRRKSKQLLSHGWHGFNGAKRKRDSAQPQGLKSPRIWVIRGQTCGL